MVLKIFFPQCCNTADSGLLVGRWVPGHNSAVVLAVIHYPFIPGQVKKYLSELQSQTQVDLTVLGSWSMPKEGQEGMESFLKDLSTIFPQKSWLQLSREIGKIGFTCQVVQNNGNLLQEQKNDDDKIVLIHYDQRKVMLSQLHPVQDVGQKSDVEPSELCLVFLTVAQSQPLFFLDKYDDGPLKLTHWQSEGREASIIAELLKQASVPLCIFLTWLLSLWHWLCSFRWVDVSRLEPVVETDEWWWKFILGSFCILQDFAFTSSAVHLKQAVHLCSVGIQSSSFQDCFLSQKSCHTHGIHEVQYLGQGRTRASLIMKRQKWGLKYMCQLLRNVLFEFMLDIVLKNISLILRFYFISICSVTFLSLSIYIFLYKLF